MSNIGLEISLKEVGGKVLRPAVGDRYVVEEMRRTGAMLGGEQSGHIVFREYITTGDGIITALQVLAIMKRNGVSLSRLARQIKLMPQILLNIPVREKEPLETLSGFQDQMEKVENTLGENGRLLVRYSGTEPLLRIMLEGPDPDQIRTFAEELAGTVRRQLG